jgi:hypothetical protein
MAADYWSGGFLLLIAAKTRAKIAYPRVIPASRSKSIIEGSITEAALFCLLWVKCDLFRLHPLYQIPDAV